MIPAAHSHARTLPDLGLAAPEMPADEVRIATTSASVGAPVIILCAIALFAFAGIAFAFWLRTVPAGNPDPRLTFNVFYFLFARNEPAGLLVVASFSLVTSLIFLRKGVPNEALQNEVAGPTSWLCASAAIIAFGIAAIGTQTVFHDYLLTADEYSTDFQARIFLHGAIEAKVPAAWVDAVRVVKPTYVEYFPSTHTWTSSYLPVYAAMRAVFQSIDLEALLNPFLATVTVLAVYGTARHIWPESKTNALVAIGLLVSSAQFLIMSMTAYAMPAHLALNAIWLWLYSRPDRRWFYLAPFVGVLALGLHQPFFHALFSAPFLLRLTLQRRWRATLVFAVVYAIGCAGWLYWWLHFRAPAQAGGMLSVFRLFNPRVPIIQSMNLWLILGWSSLATPLLVLLGCKQFFKMRPILQDALISCALTFGFYFFVYLDQAHGWGYRYFHGVIVCFILVAIVGFNRLSILVGSRRAQALVLAGIAVSLLIQFPLRCFQAERFVRPYARTAAVLHAMPNDIVAVDALDAWYSADLIRNDPFLEHRPMIVSLLGLTPAAIAVLEKGGSARFITRDDLTRLGMFTTRRNDYARDPFQLGRGK
jgi:hypothetical protein